MLAPLLLLAPLLVVAQEPAPRREPISSAIDVRVGEVRAELASNEAARVAWGAWHASEEHLEPLADTIADRVHAWRLAPSSEEQVWVLRSLTDALVRLDAKLPPGDLDGLDARFGALQPQILVLASRAPTASLPLLERTHDNARHEAWIAAVNLLATSAPERIAPKLVPEVKITVHVEVHDPDSGSGGGGSFCSGIGCGGLEAPAGFPPTALYTLKRRARTYDPPVSPSAPESRPKTLPPDTFAHGPIAIGYERTVRRERSFGIGNASENLDRADYALRSLRWIIEDRSETANDVPHLERTLTIDHAWRNAASYLTEVNEELDAYDTRWRQLLHALHTRAAIDEAIAATQAPFTIEVHDRREDTSVELPPLAPR